jgi:ABC-type transport system involved in multi-copper enzyme maturation permease subunit
MNYQMVRTLILKDWYLQRLAIAMSLLGGIAALAIIAFGDKVASVGPSAAFTLGVILLVTVVVTIGAMLGMNLTVLERKEQTLAFVMSLPVSYRDYTAAKILSVLLIFLVPWIAIMAGSLVLLAFAPGIRGLIPFIVIMGVEILMNTCIIAAAGIITESQGWTITVLMIGNLVLNGYGYFVAHIPSIGDGMFSPVVHWSPTAAALLATETAAIALILFGTFYFQSRKKDFL